jgi:hypothetical protein
MSTKWLQTLDEPQRAAAETLIATLRQLGCPDPEAWARRQFRDHAPQLSRFLLLRHLWSETINTWRDSQLWIENLVEDARDNPEGPFAGAGRALSRLLDGGADPADIAQVARFVAYESVFSVMHSLDEGFDPEHEGQLPGWALVERDPLGHPTGKLLGRLNQDLPSLDNP